MALMATVIAALVFLYVARAIFIPFAFALILSLILTPAAGPCRGSTSLAPQQH